MLDALRELFGSLKDWHSQVWNLAIIDMRKKTRGTALGWVWVFAQPAMYIICFWFALYAGVKAARITGMGGGEYMLWLSSGIIPWFFLQRMLGTGSDVFRGYSYLVTKLKFPVILIPVFVELSGMMLHLMLLACLLVGYFVAGGPPDIYLLQLPLIVVLMYVFSLGWSLMVSPLSAISKDVKNFVNALSTPIFWLSGVLFDVSSINSTAVQTVMLFNPVTFFVSSYRKILRVPSSVLGAREWIWADPVFFWCGIGVILLTVVVGLAIYSKLRKDIPDVL